MSVANKCNNKPCIYIDMNAFLDEASIFFQQRIQNVVNKYGAIKVHGVHVINDNKYSTLHTSFALSYLIQLRRSRHG